ncbi:MAG: hypothetical protein RR720_04785 [Comamonas sp.]|uniref:hypothetical protein n=1 Tax=Comamonas sp. TaxID=34028 RepID=UPI002FC9CB12
MSNTCPRATPKRRLVAKNMLQECPSIRLHRLTTACLRAAHGDTDPLVELPIRVVCVHPLSLRMTLHAVLGAKLRGYRLSWDAVGHKACVSLHVHLRDVHECLHHLTRALPGAEFGRVARVLKSEDRQCH